MMIAACLEKLSYGVAAWVLYAQGRLHIGDAYIASVDLVWLVLFIVAYLRTPVRPNEEY
jgi:heme/copper-type cytochrome/quinol oxidase subunit 3